MKIGVDSSVIVAGIHANHPLHAVASDWIIRNLAENELITTHHAVLETYAVLTRLPAAFRVSGAEAAQLLEATVRDNMAIAPFSAESIWGCISALVRISAVGGQSYDAFTAEILADAGAGAVATFNASHLQRLAPGLRTIDPSRPYAS